MAALWVTLVSALLLTGTTFAWVTLSTSPEVTGVTTSLSANGALEIALSNADGSEPDSSAVGDSMAVSGQSVTVSNLTWGNLVNLSDPSYGLGGLVLYPARLSSNLRSAPLMAVDYGSDGRVTTLTNAQRYAYWNTTYSQWTIIGAQSQYGVRAVGSVTVSSTGAVDLANLISAASSAMAAADDAYAATVSSNSGYMEKLVEMVGDRLDEKISEVTHDYAGYTETVYHMYVDLIAAADKLGEAYVAIAEIYQYSEYGATDGVKNYTPYTIAQLMEKTEAEWAEAGVTLTGWDAYLELQTALAGQLVTIKNLCAAANVGEEVSWDSIKPPLEAIFPYDSAVYIKKTTSGTESYTWSQLPSLSVAVKFLYLPTDSSTTKVNNTAWVELTEGLLYDFEDLLTYSMATDLLEAHFSVAYNGVTYYEDACIPMRVSTRSGNSYASDAISSAPEDTTAGSGTETATETYGMAIDLWVRTNASGESYLLLDGAMVTDDGGNVTGYEGSNRIWEDYDSLIVNGTSTTQGGGSCYVFYYETAEDLPRILDLLKGMKVVFFDTQAGTKLATASFDTTNYYENSGGRVTVPLVVDGTDSNTCTVKQYVEVAQEYGGETETQEVVSTAYYITALTPNEAVSITALLYVDGTAITNEEASAATDFTGTLNLQFASTATLTTAAQTGSDLYTEAVTLSAVQDVSEHVWDDTSDDQTTVVTLTVGGTASPATVTASYGRQVNSGSQALKQQTVAFVQSTEDSSIWTMTYTFPGPGTYVLTHVTLDGKEYELEEPLTVTVSGISVQSASWGYADASYTVFTADSTVTVPVSLNFSADYSGTEAVRAAFVSSSGKYVYATLTSSDGTHWSGSACITASGTYTLKYFYLGSEVYDIPETMQKTLTTYMGLRLSVQMTCADFEEGETTIVYDSENGDELDYTVNVSVKLFDNSGSALRNITGTGGLAEGQELKLRYSKSGSATSYLETALTWNSASNSYIGTFSVTDLGVYSFTSLTIGSESVSTSTSAPSLVVRNVEILPEYSGNQTLEVQTVMEGTGSFAINMAKSDATWGIKAVVQDTDTLIQYTLSGTMGTIGSSGEAVWTFPVVDGSGTALEGNFQLMELQIYTVTYRGTTKVYGDLRSAINLEAEAICTKIVKTVTVTAYYDGVEVTSESDPVTLTSAYAATSLDNVDSSNTDLSSNFYAVASYDLSELTVILTDFEGEAVDGVAIDSLTYTLDQSSTSDYGYTIVYNESDVPSPTVSGAIAADGKTVTFDDTELGFNLWGKYTSSLLYSVGSTVYEVPLNATVEYEQGVLPTFGNSAGNLYAGIAAKLNLTVLSRVLSSDMDGVYNAYYRTSSEEVQTYYNSAQGSGSITIANTSTTAFPTCDADGDGIADDIYWPAYYHSSATAGKDSTGAYPINYVLGKITLRYAQVGWSKPVGAMVVYSQNIYISDAATAPAVWIKAADDVIDDAGSISTDGIALYSGTNYFTRNFAYTSSINADGLVSSASVNGYTIKGMGIGKVEGDEGSTWSTAVIGERTILGTYDEKEVPVLATNGEYVTGYTVDDSSGKNVYTAITTDNPDDPDILYQTIMVNYEPLVIQEIYIQYFGVTYKVNTDNAIAIDNGYILNDTLYAG